MKKILLLIIFTIFISFTSFTNTSANEITTDMTAEDTPISLTEALEYKSSGIMVHVEVVHTYTNDEKTFFQDPANGLAIIIPDHLIESTIADNLETGDKVTFLAYITELTEYGFHELLVSDHLFEITSTQKNNIPIYINETYTAKSITDLHVHNESTEEGGSPLSGRIFTLQDVIFLDDDILHGRRQFIDENWVTGDEHDYILAYSFVDTNIEGLTESTMTSNDPFKSMTFMVVHFMFDNIQVVPLSFERYTHTAELIGDPHITLDYGQAFTDPGVNALDLDGIDLTVTTSGVVDSDTAGSYTITYQIKDTDGEVLETLSREVTVSEENHPTLSLIGTEMVTIDHLSLYTDLGATAINDVGDTYDVITTGDVNTSEAGLYTIEYTTITNDGTLIGPITRTVIVENPDAPIFEAPTTIIKNADYIAPSEFYLDYLTVIDFEDKNITSEIEIIKNDYNGNANIPGNYDITFRVVDSQGTTARHTITITVQNDMIPLLIIDDTTFIQSYTYKMTDQDFIDTLKAIDLLQNETFLFTDIYDNYTINYDQEGNYSKEFSLLSESGNDHNFSFTLSVIDDDQINIDKSDNFFDAAINFISTWWIAIGAIVLIGIAIKSKR